LNTISQLEIFSILSLNSWNLILTFPPPSGTAASISRANFVSWHKLPLSYFFDEGEQPSDSLVVDPGTSIVDDFATQSHLFYDVSPAQSSRQSPLMELEDEDGIDFDSVAATAATASLATGELFSSPADRLPVPHTAASSPATDPQAMPHFLLNLIRLCIRT
jgi:hypothetical protein